MAKGKQQRIDELELKVSSLKSELSSTKEEFKLKEEAHQNQVSDLENQLELLDEDIQQKQEQLDKRELKKLASAYKDQEDVYKKNTENWLTALVVVGLGLIISTAISIHLSSGKPWYDRFEYYLVDIIFLSAVWFCGSQYSNFTELRSDYANRKTLAQSFHNILNNLPEDEDIKGNFIEKATDVLCAPSVISTKEPVLSKKLVKDTAEIVKSIRG